MLKLTVAFRNSAVEPKINKKRTCTLSTPFFAPITHSLTFLFLPQQAYPLMQDLRPSQRYCCPISCRCEALSTDTQFAFVFGVSYCRHFQGRAVCSSWTAWPWNEGFFILVKYGKTLSKVSHYRKLKSSVISFLYTFIYPSAFCLFQ